MGTGTGRISRPSSVWPALVRAGRSPVALSLLPLAGITVASRPVSFLSLLC